MGSYFCSSIAEFFINISCDKHKSKLPFGTLVSAAINAESPHLHPKRFRKDLSASVSHFWQLILMTNRWLPMAMGGRKRGGRKRLKVVHLL